MGGAVVLQFDLLDLASLDALAVATVALLLAGAVVMGYSAVRTRWLLLSLGGYGVERTWRLLFGLMLFFVLGYLGAVVLVGVGDTAALIPVTGAVFFLGAVFVLLVVRASDRSIGRLVETTCFLDDVLDSMGEALLVVAPDGTVERVNPAATALIGRPREGIVGRPVADLFADGTRPFDGADVPLERSGEARVVTATGESVPVLFSASRLAVDAESGRGVVCIVRDITSRKRHELELERQNDRLDEFASVVSHDVRNPLSVAQGYLELARETGADEHFERVDGALGRIEHLIDGLLELARQGQTVGETEGIPLGTVVRVAWDTVDTADATLSTGGDLGTVRADRERLRQVLENLFSNAVEHGGSEVTVTVDRLDDAEGFFVADDGPGVPLDERETVFSHGFSTTNAGTGFGLAIVRTIVEAHGWEVSVTDSETGGARFEVRTVSIPPTPSDSGSSGAQGAPTR